MHRFLFLTIVLTAMPFVAAHAQHDHGSPYMSHTDRDIKALSTGEVEGLLEGEGMGFALAAELNGYPGPKHVLELAADLALSDDQRARTQEIFEAMQVEAREIGMRVVHGERMLDMAFAEGSVSTESIARHTRSVAEARGALRAAHLTAHLAMMDVLSDDQVTRYRVLRDYADR
jgi:hypothetical protein